MSCEVSSLCNKILKETLGDLINFYFEYRVPVPHLRMPLKFCANLTFQFQEASSILERYRLAKMAGFKGVECAFPVGVSLDELKSVQQETGLKQVLMNIDIGSVKNGSFGCASFLNSMQDFRHNLNNTIAYAKGLNCQK